MAHLDGWTRVGIMTGLLALAPRILAQEEEPPPPPPLDSPTSPAETGSVPAGPPGPNPAAAAANDDPYASDPAAIDPYAQDPYAEDPYAPSSASTDPYAKGATAVATGEEDPEYAFYARASGLRTHSTLTGSTGLLRVREAGAGPVGSFRMGFLTGMNSVGNFLCTTTAPCPDPTTGVPFAQDTSQRFDTRLTLSVTPFSFLEAYAGVRSAATSNNLSQPTVLQIVGDWNLGVKAFLPTQKDRIYSFGGELDMLLLNGLGGVGFDGGATSFTFRGLGTLDFSRRSDESRRLPLRFHANLAYAFNNSGAVVQGFETTPPPEGRGRPVERPVRYGLGISRVDAFEIGLGVEYLNKWIRPYLEWTIDVPVNRQGYVCNVPSAQSRGDLCLGRAAGLSTSPSRLSFGAVGYPWQKSGLSVSLGFDVGTGGTTVFLEETTPEAPYLVWLGLGYAVDVSPLELPREEAKPLTPPDARRFLVGRVVDEKSGLPVGDALLRYASGDLTGMIAGGAGTFRSQDLAPGTYRLLVSAKDYVETACEVVVPETATAAAAPPPASESTAPTATAATATADIYGETSAAEAPAPAPPSSDIPALPQEPYLSEAGEILVPVTCGLKELPQVATVTGLILDARSGGAVPDASITVTDKLGRSLELRVDAQGAFQFRNVPFGTTYLVARAPGYLATVLELEVTSRADLSANLVMNKLPARPGITVSRTELVFSQPLTFIAETPDVAVESMSVIEELAYVLDSHPEIARVEVQVHTDDSGSAAEQRRISQERADEIRNLLVRLGVAPSRVSAKGYGPDQPLSPNVSEQNRAKNRRVQVVIGTSSAASADTDSLGL